MPATGPYMANIHARTTRQDARKLARPGYRQQPKPRKAMFKPITAKRAGAPRGYGYVLLWASNQPRPAYMLRPHMHWYRYKADALEGAARMNRSIQKVNP